MSLILRKIKGAPLTSDEVDGNFQNLLERITALEETPKGEGIARVVEDQGEIRVIGSEGSYFGSFLWPQTRPVLPVFREAPLREGTLGALALYEEGALFWVLFYDGNTWRKVNNGDDVCK